jgi:ribosome-associated protein
VDFSFEKEPVMTREKTEYITLQQFLKKAGLVQSGGEAKVMILQENVSVNGIPETHRGRKLYPGDIVEACGRKLVVG